MFFMVHSTGAHPPRLTRRGFEVAWGYLRALVQMVTVSMLVLSLGLHWAVLQTAAWAGMLVTYSRDGSFRDAVVKTFDGKHPCSLCRAIKQGRAAEPRQNQHQVKPGSKLDLGLIWTATPFQFVRMGRATLSFDLPVRSRADEPPKPRPRRFLPEPSARG